MIAFADDGQMALPLFCRHCNLPIPLTSGLCPSCGHRPTVPKSECDCLECDSKRVMAKAQRPRWLNHHGR